MNWIEASRPVRFTSLLGASSAYATIEAGHRQGASHEFNKKSGQQGHRRPMVHGILGQVLESKDRRRTRRARHPPEYLLQAPRRGRADVKMFMTEFREAFPDLSVTGAANFVCEGDHIVGRWEGWGTHTGPAYCDFLVGCLPAASAQKMRFSGTTVLRLSNGKIAEQIGLDDGATALLQLGLEAQRDRLLPAARMGEFVR